MINKYLYKDNNFKTVEEFQSHLRSTNHASDYIVINNILYTMEEYDMAGRQVSYYNRRTNNMVLVATSNRYDTGYLDAEVELFENYGFYRNDITYAD